MVRSLALTVSSSRTSPTPPARTSERQDVQPDHTRSRPRMAWRRCGKRLELDSRVTDVAETLCRIFVEAPLQQMPHARRSGGRQRLASPARAPESPRSCPRSCRRRTPLVPSAFRRARSRTPRCRCACRPPCLAPARGSCTPRVPRIMPASRRIAPSSSATATRPDPTRLRRSRAFASPKSSTFTVPSSRDLDVRGLQVSMDDPLFVRRFERLGDLRRDRQRLAEWDRPRSRSDRRASGPRPVP